MLAGVCARSIVFMYKYSTPDISFDHHHTRLDPLLTLFLPDRGISRICQRTRLTGTQTGQVVFVPAEILSGSFNFIRAELVIDHTPDELVRLHIVRELIER